MVAASCTDAEDYGCDRNMGWLVMLPRCYQDKYSNKTSTATSAIHRLNFETSQLMVSQVNAGQLLSPQSSQIRAAFHQSAAHIHRLQPLNKMRVSCSASSRQRWWTIALTEDLINHVVCLEPDTSCNPLGGVVLHDEADNGPVSTSSVNQSLLDADKRCGLMTPVLNQQDSFT